MRKRRPLSRPGSSRLLLVLGLVVAYAFIPEGWRDYLLAAFAALGGPIV